MNHNPYRAYWEKAQEQSLKLAQFYTPECLVDLCIELLKPTGELFDPCCGLGSFLLKAKSKDETLKISGNDIDPNLGEQGLDPFNKGLKLPFEFTNSDYLNSEDKEFDYIIANIPFNMKKNHCNLVYENYCWIEKIIKNTRKKALIILPNMVNSRHNPKILAKRKQIVDSGVIELVYQVPPKLFPQTAIGPAIWLIDKAKTNQDIWFLYSGQGKFSALENKKRTLTSENIREICNRDNWSLGTYEKIRKYNYTIIPGIYAYKGEKPQETEEEVKQKIRELAKEAKKIMGELIPLQSAILDWLTNLEKDGEIF